MSRIVINRGPPPKRKSTKGGRQTKETTKERKQWERGHAICGVCDYSPMRETHHMKMGSQRYDAPWNWIPTCRDCHDLIHNPTPRLWLIFLAKRKEKCDGVNADTNKLLEGK